MNKQQLFALLEEQPPSKILELLKDSYNKMSTEQRKLIFGQLVKKPKPIIIVTKNVIKEVKQFYEDSLGGRYYASFNINSKNFRDIPEETEEWFSRLSELLRDSVKLSERGEDEAAVECFKLLNELIDRMSDGEEIVFADEYGTWMIYDDEKKRIKAYATSLAKVAISEEFTEAMLPIIRRDSYESFSSDAYSLIRLVANKEQQANLDEELKNQKIRIKTKL